MKNSASVLPQVALDFMNIVHEEEWQLTRSLLQALDTADEERVSALLGEWLAHTEAHFAREERFMQEYRFPPFPIHKREHQLALARLQSVAEQWQTTHDHGALAAYIEQEWASWLANHIATLDTVTANFLSQFGIEVTL